MKKSGLTFAGLEQQYNTAARIDLTTGERKSIYGVQPLDFIFDGSGGINTGRVGLSDSTFQGQQELSKKFGIPTLILPEIFQPLQELRQVQFMEIMQIQISRGVINGNCKTISR